MSPPSAVEVEGVRDTEGIPLPNPLSVNGVFARRAKAGKLIAGTAAFASSDHFKGKVSEPTLGVSDLD
jgi:aromatic amino acid aminotransferase I